VRGLTQSGPTVGGFILEVLRYYPNRTAFTWDGGSLTYHGASNLIGQIQAAFVARGLHSGQVMAFLTGNRVESWCASIAALASGLAITWLHQLASLEDHVHQLNDAGADALVIDARRFADRGCALAAQADRLKCVFSVDASDFGVDLIRAAQSMGAVTARNMASPEDIAYVNYTGGTTGFPKGVMRRNSSLSTKSYATILSDFEIPQHPRYLAVAPISHVAGIKIPPTLTRGGSVHLIDGFSPERVLRAIEREHPNFTLLIPTMIYALLDDPAMSNVNLSSLQLVLYGASSMSPAHLREGMERIGPVFSQLYGQTECYPISLLQRADHDLSRIDLLASSGRPVTTCAVVILDDEGNEVPLGEVGEICVRSPLVMDAYMNLPELTADTLKGGWLHTGDVGRRDDRGYLFIVDRKKDMIITSGSNVFSRGVEDVLATHPAVARAVVFGTPDEKLGEAVNAAVVLRDGANVDPAVLIEFVRGRKGSLQAPKAVYFVEEMPLTSLGKVDKQALKKRFAGRS
jgi:fatty-acyl-CoA synthase